MNHYQAKKFKKEMKIFRMKMMKRSKMKLKKKISQKMRKIKNNRNKRMSLWISKVDQSVVLKLRKLYFVNKMKMILCLILNGKKEKIV